MLKYIRNYVYQLKNHLKKQTSNSGPIDCKERILLAQILININNQKNNICGLEEVEFSCFSQWGEDGIIQFLINRIPNINKRFVEFGVGNYRESNTRLLLFTNNWTGLVIDGSEGHIADIKSQDIFWRYNFQAISHFVDIDNINRLISTSGIVGEIGLLSIDVDGNDYWIWDAINVVNPIIVICEYNAVLGDIYQLTIPYKDSFYRTNEHSSNLYFGASIRALVNLGLKKGYTFIGSSINGCNAFFVRSDCMNNIYNSIDLGWAYPSQIRESRDHSGILSFVSGIERAQLIQKKPLIDLSRNNEVNIAELMGIYSSAWLQGEKTRIISL